MTNKSLNKLEEDVMGFLNEVQLNFPEAISMASGRPEESFFDLQHAQEYMDMFVNFRSKETNVSTDAFLRSLGQYNRTKGIINDIVVKYLKNDYQIDCSPADIIVNVGSQESMILSLLALMNRDEDVFCVEDPSYVGISHFALINGYETAPIAVDAEGINLEALEKTIEATITKGKRVKAVYVIPDFQNPTGIRTPIEKRKKLLQMAATHNFMIIEDNAYGDFVFEDVAYPTLKSLDTEGNVIYLHSFSKSLHPSLRMGVMVTDKVFKDGTKLSDIVAKIKGYTTVNSPAIPQAILGGVLLKNNYSLQKYNEEKCHNVRQKRDSVLASLTKYINASQNETLQTVSWNVPEGGYFLTLTLPFAITKEDVTACAKNYHVIFTPMSFFHLSKGGENQIRIAYSYVKINQIETAIENLVRFLATKITNT
ncbi:(S)-3,5-dihydroxyphenylglycine transaminase [Kordia periserrulae]|uniref:(S)-3,5-dihydroxyphenylglycine transaminase n=1 Tax=Kordia periserrulae TaxID=701523 RepID=A0A2T6BZ64_9FLAO|nr:PLP-dependent aminotransferase family protein [Kordia periserrulae]PTX61375.1 (S)-3,5-dihydroxyphenylglycine transaminase [Kordia periserrulae]